MKQWDLHLEQRALVVAQHRLQASDVDDLQRLVVLHEPHHLSDDGAFASLVLDGVMQGMQAGAEARAAL